MLFGFLKTFKASELLTANTQTVAAGGSIWRTRSIGWIVWRAMALYRLLSYAVLKAAPMSKATSSDVESRFVWRCDELG